MIVAKRQPERMWGNVLPQLIALTISFIIFSFNIYADSEPLPPWPPENPESLSPELEKKYEDWKINKKWVDALLEEAEPGQEYIESGCYIFRVSDLQEYSRNGWYVFLRKWTSGLVYYSFYPDGMTDYKKNQFRLATREWENVAAVAFIELEYGMEGVSNYIEVHDSTRNSSIIGMAGDKQILNMYNWEYKFIIVHEIGHALGQWHEHTRSDRDTFVDIDFNNIDPRYNASNWSMQPGEDLGTTYDFESALHYGPSSGAISGTTIITAADPQYQSFFDQGLVGQRDRLSDGDKAGMVARYGALVQAAAPDTDFPSGTYNSQSITVTLFFPFDYQAGLSEFRYTLDGTDPTEDSTLWDPPNYGILLRNSVTLKVRHYRKLKSPSPVTERNYVLTQSTPLVATPDIQPADGTYNDAFFVSMSTSTSGADIRYTTNGAIPTENSALYTGPFFQTQSALVRAKAFKDGYTPSDVATRVYEITPAQLPPPVVEPADGTFNGSVIVNMYSTVQGAVVRYTTNNTEPTATSVQVDENPIVVTQNTTVKAKAFRDGFTPSNTTTRTYTIIPGANTPTINPNGGSHSGSPNITLSTSTAGADIYYTTNGAEPTQQSTKYTSSFTVGFGETTVKAKAFLENADPSGTASATFTVFDPNIAQVTTPYFRPNTPSHIDEVEISIFCDTQGATIYYQIDDEVLPGDPTPGMGITQEYTGPFTVGLPTIGDFWFINAIAVKGGSTDSNVPQRNYKVTEPITPTANISDPTYDPDGGTFNNTVEVTISAIVDPAGGQSGLQIYSTTDGSEPEIPDPPGLGDDTINLSTPGVIKAIGYRDLWPPSNITTSQEFFFVCADPEFTPDEGVYYESVEVSFASDTTGGGTRIRYTTDGTIPEDDDGVATKYQNPFTLGLGTHIVRAQTYRNNFDPSEIITRVYVVQETPVVPVITDQPTSLTIDQGQTAEFTISATGTPDPDYQWFYNGTGIAGETTTTLRIPNAQPGDEGEYFCVVSNTAGATTSSIALLMVNAVITPTPTASPTITITPTPSPTGTVTPTPGTTGTLTLILGGTLNSINLTPEQFEEADQNDDGEINVADVILYLNDNGNTPTLMLYMPLVIDAAKPIVPAVPTPTPVPLRAP